MRVKLRDMAETGVLVAIYVALVLVDAGKKLRRKR